MNKYLPIVFCIAILFTACYNNSSLEEEKDICIKQNKKFYVTEVTNSDNSQTKLKVICK